MDFRPDAHGGDEAAGPEGGASQIEDTTRLSEAKPPPDDVEMQGVTDFLVSDAAEEEEEEGPPTSWPPLQLPPLSHP